MLPIVAIVGRANVGKSTLFNRIVGKNLSIVEDTPGVTRDRIFSKSSWDGIDFEIIDTGGIEVYEHFTKIEEEKFLKEIKQQAELAIEIADVILFVVDVKTGVDSRDESVLRIIKKSKKPLITVCNKNDDFTLFNFYEFYKLGVDEIHPVSAIHGKGVGELLDVLVEKFDVINKEPLGESVVNISVVGKPNVGKSSLINKILGQYRTIVSDVAGTTRDSIDIEFEKNGKTYNLIDTAGLRKKNKITRETIEYYSVIRSLASINKSHICLVLVDANEGITEQDEKIIGYIDKQGKASLLIINKWDLVEKDTYTSIEFEKKIRGQLRFIKYLEILLISAKTGKRVEKIFDKVNEILVECNKRIPTGKLNSLLADIVTEHQPPTDKGRRLKIYYITQATSQPPTFVLFVNNTQLAHFSYVRYIENKLRESFSFKGVPIKLILRGKGEKFKLKR